MKLKDRLSSSRIIILGFMAAILTGTVLLMLPVSAKSGTYTSFSDALFTATSAACVTGLVVEDTASYWSMFGQLVILLLIQAGGMGIVTSAAMIAIISGRRIDLKQRSTMMDALSAPSVGGIVRLTGFILKVSLSAEALGAVLLMPRFIKEEGILKGIWYSVFHSVSAFCNAGFDLMGSHSRFSSFTAYSSDIWMNVVLMMLIIAGGIGFLTWDDIRVNRTKVKKYRMQTKVVLTVASVLISVSAVYFFFFEFGSLPMKERILVSLFQSVTPRTAGFNTADMASLSETGCLITVFLMLVGGSPGSTAGGMKMTTLAVIVSTAASVFKRRESTQFFGRRISDKTVRTAVAILAIYLFLFITGGVIISRTEGLPLADCLFETASAVGTVGLTLGMTPSLGACSRWILVVLMFLGRVGGLTIIYSAFSGPSRTLSKPPVEKITVG